jgi:transcriptional regulator with XRE-family HTH domain
MKPGEELKRIRLLNELSARKFAEYVGIDAARLRKWEDYGINPKEADTEIIENFFNVPIDELNKIKKFKFKAKRIVQENLQTNSEDLLALKAKVKILMEELKKIRHQLTKESAAKIYLDLDDKI